MVNVNNLNVNFNNFPLHVNENETTINNQQFSNFGNFENFENFSPQIPSLSNCSNSHLYSHHLDHSHPQNVLFSQLKQEIPILSSSQTGGDFDGVFFN